MVRCLPPETGFKSFPPRAPLPLAGTKESQTSNEIELGKSILYLTRDEVIGLGITRKEVLEYVNTAMVEHGHKR